MAFDAHKNFAYSTVATAPSPATSGTSLVVAAGTGTLFPAVPFNATVWPAGAQPTTANAEIVRVTNISTDTLTIARAQESSAARSVIVGDQIAATITARTITDIQSATDTIPWTWVTKGSDESVASSTALQADDALLFTAVSGAQYEIEFQIIYGSPVGAGTPDIKVAFGEDATSRGTWLTLGWNTADSGVNTGVGLANNAAVTTHGTAATDREIKAWVNYVGGGGTFALYWAQNTSGVGATIVRAGSVLRYRRIV